jgi:hypothetical protein
MSGGGPPMRQATSAGAVPARCPGGSHRADEGDPAQPAPA